MTHEYLKLIERGKDFGMSPYFQEFTLIYGLPLLYAFSNFHMTLNQVNINSVNISSRLHLIYLTGAITSYIIFYNYKSIE